MPRWQSVTDQSLELAEDRTDLAEDRTVLANERTLGSWIRTGFAAIGIGLAFNALFQRMDPAWLPRLISTAFLLIAVAIFLSAERRSCAVIARLKPHTVKTIRPTRVRMIVWASVAATLALVWAVWFGNFYPRPQA